MKKYLIAPIAGLIAIAAQAAEPVSPVHSPYAGQEKRQIKSLSAEDIAELQRGGGWGLAKAAELNGVPGPAHLLKLKDEIPLDPAQVEAITGIFDQMKRQAVERGTDLIDLERNLERHFREGTITDAILRDQLDAIAAARKELRYIHLSTHLETPALLTPEQITAYRNLRGYEASSPCGKTHAHGKC